MRHIRPRPPAFTAGFVFALLSIPASAVPVTVSNLVTDDPTINTAITDSDLKNGWVSLLRQAVRSGSPPMVPAPRLYTA